MEYWGGFSQGPVTSLPLPSQSGATYLTYEIQAMDVNFDGLMDLIIAYQRDVLLGGWELQVLENQGAQQFIDKTQFYIPDASARSDGIPSQEDKQSQQWVQFLRFADLNNDGRMDFTLDSRGITTAPPNLPVAYLHQADGTFVVATASQLAPDMGWYRKWRDPRLCITGRVQGTRTSVARIQQSCVTDWRLPKRHFVWRPG